MDPTYASSLVEAVARTEVLSSAFQPVFRAGSGELEGCEALARLPEGSGFDGPYEAFRTAIRSNMLLSLQSAAIVRHLLDARPYLGGYRLFMNVVAPLFTDESFGVSWLLDHVLAAGIKPGQVVLELPEMLRVRDLPRFAKHIEPFRREGFRIAIDDFGAGYTNLREIVELTPEFVKIDRVFVEGIASHARKRVLVESVTTLCHRVNCAVVAEGVETTEELETCLAAEVDYLQGFLFARPSPAKEAFSVAPISFPIPFFERSGDDVRDIVVPVPPVEASESLDAVGRRFLEEEDAQVLPVVAAGIPVGLFRRETVGAILRAARAGVTSVPAAGDPLATSNASMDQLAELASPEEAADIIARRSPARRFDPLVAVGPDRTYRGLVFVDALLSLLARLKVDYSVQSNPVTQLPRRLVLEKDLSARIARDEPVAVTRICVTDFGAFVDRYGFSRGDQVLINVASLLREGLREDRGSFAAHLSGRDFAYLSAPSAARGNAIALGKAFDELAPTFSDSADTAAGKAPLLSLAFGVSMWGPGETVAVRSLLDEAGVALAEACRLPSRPRLVLASRASAHEPAPASTPGSEARES